MVDPNRFIQTLHAKLPQDLHDAIPAIEEVLRQVPVDDVDYDLSRVTVKREHSIITFGRDNQFGDIVIKEVAGGNIIKNEIHLPLFIPRISADVTLRRQTRTPRYRPTNWSFHTPNLYPLYRNILYALRLIIFSCVGFMVGWSISGVVIGDAYLISSVLFPPSQVFTALSFLLGGLMYGLSFEKRKRRRKKTLHWFIHVILFAVSGAIVYLLMYLVLNDSIPESFWIGGFFGWLILLFTLQRLKG